MTTTKRATLYDVAEYCGVSYQTVSRVINDSPHVAPKTRRMVEEAIKALGYQPNKAARMLATRRSSILEVITFGLDYYGPMQMIVSIEMLARTMGYQLLFSTIESYLDAGGEPNNPLNVLSGLTVDGVILIAPVEGPIFDQVAGLYRGIPVVEIVRPNTARPSVLIDQAKGAALATQHLIDQGHRRIGAIPGPQMWYDGVARHQSWQDTLAANGLQAGPVAGGDWTARSGYAAARRILEERGQGAAALTALVVGNDQMALGAIRAIRERGLRVPEDISVVGFDDIPEAEFGDPPLTTVRQDFTAMGKQAVDLLVQLIRAPDTPAHQRVIYPEFIERASTCPPAG